MIFNWKRRKAPTRRQQGTHRCVLVSSVDEVSNEGTFNLVDLDSRMFECSRILDLPFRPDLHTNISGVVNSDLDVTFTPNRIVWCAKRSIWHVYGTLTLLAEPGSLPEGLNERHAPWKFAEIEEAIW